MEIDPETQKYNWTNFKKLAKLEKKYDERMQEYYEHFRVMCLKVCKKDDQIPPDWGELVDCGMIQGKKQFIVTGRVLRTRKQSGVCQILKVYKEHVQV